MIYKISRSFLIVLFFCHNCIAQYSTTTEMLKDLSDKARTQVLNFFDNVEQLGKNDLTPELKQKAIQSVVKTFTPKGTVEERSKREKEGKTRKIKDYLEAIKVRGEKNRVLISYEIIDDITPNELKREYNKDSSELTLKGDLIVRQYYCRLKPQDELTDKLSENCAYSDTTDKIIHIEIRILKDTQRNKSFAVLIDKIAVLSVK